jgi:hypothetical protein
VEQWIPFGPESLVLAFPVSNISIGIFRIQIFLAVVYKCETQYPEFKVRSQAEGICETSTEEDIRTW